MDSAKKLMSALGADQSLLDRAVYLRRGIVTARDSTTLTCTVAVGGTTDPAEEVDDIPVMAGYVPVVDTDVILVRSGASWLAVGSLTAELPKIRARSTATNTTAAEVQWVFGASVIEDDTDFDGAGTMFDSANGRFVIRWPGVYEYGVHSFADPGTSGSQTIVRVQLNSTTYIDAWQHNHSGTNAMHINMANRRRFAPGDTIRLMISASASTTFGTNSNEIGTAMWMHYVP